MTQATQGTDIEDWIAKLLTKDLTEVKVGVAALRKADLEVAASGLGTILEINSVILEIENDDKRNDEFEGFLRRAETVVDNAELVFAKVETTEEKIRAVEIAVLALISTSICRGAEVIRIEIRAQVQKLLELDRVLRDARDELSPSGSTLSVPEKRQPRVRAVLMVIIHSEVFAATNKLEPVLPEIAGNYPMRALLLSGVFYGAKNLWELRKLQPAQEEGAVAAAITEAGSESANLDGDGGGSDRSGSSTCCYFSDKETAVVAAVLGKAEEEDAAAKAKAEAEAEAEAEAATKARVETGAVARAKLSAEEQKQQNQALHHAAQNGYVGKLEAAIAAGAEVSWHSPNNVSELSELE